MSILSSQSISYEYIKVRWKEPYVSEAVNRRFWGTIPKGIYNGFIITAGPGAREITVGPGSVSGTGGLGTGLTGPGYVSGLYDETVSYSIAIHNSSLGYSAAVILTPGIHQSYTLDCTGLDGQRVYAALDVQYSPNQESAAQVKLVDAAELDLNPSLIVIGHVDVPANPMTAISIAHIGYDDPNYPRITPLSTPRKAGLMPASAWEKLDQTLAWADLVYPARDVNNFYVLAIKPSQKVVVDKRIVTYVRANVPSKFPRSVSEEYNGGVANDQQTFINFQTGTISGAHQIPGNLTIPTPSIVGTPNQWQVCIVSIDSADRIQTVYGSAYASKALAVADDNLPIPGRRLFQIAAVALHTDDTGVLQPFSPNDIIDRRTFLNLGGGAGGDANELLERMKVALASSIYSLMQPVVFETDESAYVDNASTGVFSQTDGLFQIDSGENLTTIQLLDTEFLASEQDVGHVDLLVYWQLAGIDTAATYELSRDGGLNWQTVTMERVGQSDAYRGSLAFAATANATLQTYALSNADTTEVLNATTAQRISQIFSVSAAQVARQVEVYLNKLGSPTGYITLQIARDNGGVPGDVLASSIPISIDDLASGDITVAADLGAVALAVGDYHLVIASDASYQSSFSAGVHQVAVRSDSSSPTIASLQSFNGTTWASVTGEAACFAVRGRVLDLRVRITSSQAGRKIAGLSVLFQPESSSVNGVLQTQTITFNGTNQSTFALNFLPHPELLQVHWVQTGQTFVHPAFDLDGQNVVFAPDTFNVSGDVTLVFRQTQGAAFDTSDQNAQSIASNTSRIAVIESKDQELIADFRWQSNDQILMPASSIVIGPANTKAGTLYTASNLVFDFANGTGNNGLDTGTRANQQWYALYAVPLNSTTYTLKASVNLPPQVGGAGPVGFANYRYLGVFRCGDMNTRTNEILRFIKSRNRTIFTSAAGFYVSGLLLASSSAAGNTVSYSPVYAMNGAALPFNPIVGLFESGVLQPGVEQWLVSFSYSGGGGNQFPGGSIDSGGSKAAAWFAASSEEITTIRGNVSSFYTTLGSVIKAIGLGGYIDPLL